MKPASIELKNRIRDYLQHIGSATDKQVGRFAQVAPQTAYRYLAELCDDGVAHRTHEYNPKGSWLVTFNFGPAPADRFDVRAVVKSWAPMGTVDPWMLPREFFQPTGIAA